MHRRQISWWALGVIGLVWMSACTPAAPPRRSAASNQSTDGIILQDDFSDVKSGWDRQSSAEASTDYETGQYAVTVPRANYDAWGLAGFDLNDMQIAAEARYAGGPENNSFGLLCRHTRRGDKSSFYFFFISTDGYYGMGKVVRNERTYLNPAKAFEPLAALQTGPAAVNQLDATCKDQQMTFTINGQRAGEFTDSDLAHGDVGLSAGTFEEGGVKILFDNVVVRQP